MRLISIYITFLQIKRAAQIISIIASLALSEMLTYIGFEKLYRWRKREAKPRSKATTPQRIRQTIEKLGPTFIKFGQIIADRPDVVSKSFRVELKKLQSSALPFDNKMAHSIIAKSLPKPVDKIFSYISDDPIAAASIGQVYNAKLITGKEVIIKVQRPYIENKIKLDIYLMKILARRLARNYPELTAINIIGLIDEFSQSIIKELDYTNESNNIKLFTKMYSSNPKVKIPRVFDGFSNRIMIVMEKISGVTPNSRQALIDAKLNPEEVVKNGCDTIISMILKHGVFHADPHPGNLFITEGNVIGIIDFGMVGVLRQREIDFIADFIMGFHNKDADMITGSLLTLCGVHYYDGYEDLRYDIKQMLLQNMGAKIVDMRNFSKIMQYCIDLMVKHGLQIPSGIFLLVKTFATLEKFAQSLAPNVELSSIVIPYAKAIVKERYSSKRFAHTIFETISNYIDFIRELPENLNEIIFKLKEGKIKHDIRLEDDMLFTRTLRAITWRLSYTILLIGLFIGSTILIVWDSDRKFGLTILYGSSLLILMMLLKWLFKRDNMKNS